MKENLPGTIKLMENIFEINLHSFSRELKRYSEDEISISVHIFNINEKQFRDVFECTISKETFINYLNTTKINVKEEVPNEFIINSMKIPWFDIHAETNKKNRLTDLLIYKIILKIINYYFYLKSASKFEIETEFEPAKSRDRFTSNIKKEFQLILQFQADLFKFVLIQKNFESIATNEDSNHANLRKVLNIY